MIPATQQQQSMKGRCEHLFTVLQREIQTPDPKARRHFHRNIFLPDNDHDDGDYRESINDNEDSIYPAHFYFTTNHNFPLPFN